MIQITTSVRYAPDTRTRWQRAHNLLSVILPESDDRLPLWTTLQTEIVNVAGPLVDCTFTTIDEQGGTCVRVRMEFRIDHADMVDATHLSATQAPSGRAIDYEVDLNGLREELSQFTLNPEARALRDWLDCLVIVLKIKAMAKIASTTHQ